MRIARWLIEHKTAMNYLLIAWTILIGTLLYIFPRLSYPFLVAAVLLFLALNQDTIDSYWNAFLSHHYWLKLQYFWFVVGGIWVLLLLYGFFGEFIPVFTYPVAIFLFIHLIWVNKIHAQFISLGNSVILKDYTTKQGLDVPRVGYIFFTVMGIMIALLFAAFQAMIETRARSLFTISGIVWFVIPLILLIYGIADLIFLNQITWKEDEGIVHWKQVTPIPVPNRDEPEKLRKYFNHVGKLKTPPEEALTLLKDNYAYFVNSANRFEYFPFQIELVNAYTNWGRAVKNHLHFMLGIVFASISKYRILGLIPLVRREMFYNAIRTIALSGALTSEWRELIEYEVANKTDQSQTLRWITGNKYLPSAFPSGFFMAWEGDIYLGKKGYYLSQQKLETIRHTYPEFDDWGKELWDTIIRYASVYIGEGSRRVFSNESYIYNEFLFISQGKRLAEYREFKKEYQQKLREPQPIHVDRPAKHDYTDEERKLIVERYLSSEPYVPPVPSLPRYIYNKLGEWLGQITKKHIAYFIAILMLLILNLYLLVQFEYVFPGWGKVLLGAEILFIIFVVIPTSPSLFAIGTDQGALKTLLEGNQFPSYQKKIDPGISNRSFLILLYCVVLAIIFAIVIY